MIPDDRMSCQSRFDSLRKRVSGRSSSVCTAEWRTGEVNRDRAHVRAYRHQAHVARGIRRRSNDGTRKQRMTRKGPDLLLSTSRRSRQRTAPLHPRPQILSSAAAHEPLRLGSGSFREIAFQDPRSVVGNANRSRCSVVRDANRTPRSVELRQPESYGPSWRGVVLSLGSGARMLAMRRPATSETAVSTIVNAVAIPVTVSRSINDDMLR